MYKETKWAKRILSMQKEDGSWGYFHTLSEPNKYPITTEQALRRLAILGYTIEDEPILRAVSYMSDCLAGKKQTPDRREKLHDWDIFMELMLSTWIRRFMPDHEKAVSVAKAWANVITHAFASGEYAHDDYTCAYKDTFGKKAQGGRIVNFVSFYQVSLLADQFDERTECKVFDYILNKEDGIYYIYGRPMSVLPECFASKSASRYLGGIELLTHYRRNVSKLSFVTDWLHSNRNEAGSWDMGSSVKDHIYFPLSDSWNKKADRELDCTYRIQTLITYLETDRAMDIGGFSK